MNKKRLTTELSDEELLTLLSNAKVDEQVEATYTNEKTPTDVILQFLQSFDLKEGPHKITVAALYRVFIQWNDTKLIKTRKVFAKQLTTFIPSTSIGNKLYYFINKDKFKLFSDAFKSNKNRDVKIKSYAKHIESFLDQCGVKPGKVYIEGSLLYHLYDTWAYKSKRKSQLKYLTFISICKLYLKSKFLNKFQFFCIGFAIDQESIKQHLPEEVVRRWRNGEKIDKTFNTNYEVLYEKKKSKTTY